MQLLNNSNQPIQRMGKGRTSPWNPLSWDDPVSLGECTHQYRTVQRDIFFSFALSACTSYFLPNGRLLTKTTNSFLKALRLPYHLSHTGGENFYICMSQTGRALNTVKILHGDQEDLMREQALWRVALASIKRVADLTALSVSCLSWCVGQTRPNSIDQPKVFTAALSWQLWPRCMWWALVSEAEPSVVLMCSQAHRPALEKQALGQALSS